MSLPFGNRDQGIPQWSRSIISLGASPTNRSTTSWSARKSDPLTVSHAWRS